MPIPGEGIESTYKNSVDDVQIFLDTKHPSRFAIVNLSQRPAKLKGKVGVKSGLLSQVLVHIIHDYISVRIFICIASSLTASGGKDSNELQKEGKSNLFVLIRNLSNSNRYE